MKRFLEQTIWASAAIRDGEWKYRNVKRVLFPIFDGLMLLSGFSAVLFGIPTLDEFLARS